MLNPKTRSDSMSNDNYIRNLLNIKDKNIVIDFDKMIVKKVKYIDTKFIYGKLSYTPDFCPCCGCTNVNYSIIKNGTKVSNIKMLNVCNLPTVLVLNKQRFLCKSCGSSFSANSDFVDRFSFISNDVKRKIFIDLMNVSSFKSIAEDNGVSINSVYRVFKGLHSSFSTNFSYLPSVLSFDEFKSTRNVDGSMSFIFTDATTGDIVDILPDRRLFKLEKYFLRFPRRVRDNVSVVVCDIYSPYMQLIKKVFRNASIVIDKFHIIQNFTRAFNMARVQLMKKFSANSHEYRALKRYWKLLLKPKSSLISSRFKSYPCFKKFTSQKEIVEHILEFDESFKRVYEIMQNVLFAIRNRNFKLLKDILFDFDADSFDGSYDRFKSAINTAIRYLDDIKNTLYTSFSNGKLEGINNKIKVIKRVSYGYRSFDNFRLRILLCFYHKKIYGLRLIS